MWNKRTTKKNILGPVNRLFSFFAFSFFSSFSAFSSTLGKCFNSFFRAIPQLFFVRSSPTEPAHGGIAADFHPSHHFRVPSPIQQAHATSMSPCYAYIVWFHVLAVAAPWRVKHDGDGFVGGIVFLLGEVVELLRGQFKCVVIVAWLCNYEIECTKAQ